MKNCIKQITSIVLCLTLTMTLTPSSFAAVSKEQIYADIDPMIDAQDYDGIANYFIKLKNETYTVDGATQPYVKGNTLYLPSSLTEISDEAFAFDTSIENIVIPDSVVSITDNAFDGIENLTIIASESSYAYSWAVSNGFAVSTLPATADQFTIMLTTENFDDYFEFVTLPYYNSFGEVQEDRCRLGVRSKLFDLGYVITDWDATLELLIDYGSGPRTQEFSLYSLLYFGHIPPLSHVEVSLNRLICNGITYMNSDLVTYDLYKKIGYDTYSANIKYKTETGSRSISRVIVDGYLY